MGEIRFGTDGVRGRAFDELSLGLAYRIGRAAAVELAGEIAYLGRDTRASGPALRDALAAGLIAGGVTPIDLGVAPTPAVAWASAQHSAIGVMISASHNPWHDNGIKLFTTAGSKLSDAEQAAIERALDTSNGDPAVGGAAPAEIESMQHLVGDWVDSVVATATSATDSGLRVVVDAANGAASHVVAPALANLGLDVTVIANEPDGRNINDNCGSTHPEMLAAAVRDRQAALGLALDGDADRLLCVDAAGRVIDGDHLMAILAADMRAQGRLADDTVVVTVMSNIGFHRAMESQGIAVHVTPVGDRHILDALAANGWSFGGEQSGHLIFGELAHTGDGFLSGLQLIDIMARSRRSLAELADDAMTSFPQVLRNVRVAERVADPAAGIAAEIAAAEHELGDDGRVLIRASGTEPVIRVMVEAAQQATADRVCGELCDAVSDRFGP